MELNRGKESVTYSSELFSLSCPRRLFAHAQLTSTYGWGTTIFGAAAGVGHFHCSGSCITRDGSSSSSSTCCCFCTLFRGATAAAAGEEQGGWVSFIMIIVVI